VNNVKIGEAELVWLQMIFKEVATVRLWELRVWMREALNVDVHEATLWKTVMDCQARTRVQPQEGKSHGRQRDV
jgi:hypothetical protein